MAATALLVMDLQNGILSRLPSSDYLSLISKLLAAARAASLPIIYVTISFRPGHPESAQQNLAFSRIPSTAFITGSAETQIPEAIAPQEGDIQVTKKRYSAFAGSDLEVVLRSLGVRRIVLTGVSTSGVVLSTLREAADKDFEITVLKDACLDGDEEVHRVLMEKVFPKQAEVVGAEEWLEGLKGKA